MSKSAGFTLSVFASCLEHEGFHSGHNVFNATQECTDELYVDSICDLVDGSKIQCLCNFNSNSPFMVPKCEWQEYFPITTTMIETTTKILTTEITTTELTTESTFEMTTENITTSTLDIFNDYCTTTSSKIYNFLSGKLDCSSDGFCEIECEPGTIPSKLISSEHGRCSKFTHPKKVSCSDVIDHWSRW